MWKTMLSHLGFLKSRLLTLRFHAMFPCGTHPTVRTKMFLIRHFSSPGKRHLPVTPLISVQPARQPRLMGEGKAGEWRVLLGPLYL